ncbi:MAG: hypothetical protein KJ574_00650 [Nanoarchaeota archaeon]|nr:hypothetical protein [Nanoarchaeota archaeon]
MATNLIVSVISIGVVIGLFALHIFSKKIHYFVGGLILAGMGVLELLFGFGVVSLDINEYPVVHFAVYFMVVFAGKDLLKEGFHEGQPYLRYPSIILALILIIITTIPTLNTFGVISYVLPEYPHILDMVLYILSGIFLLIGTFFIIKE